MKIGQIFVKTHSNISVNGVKTDVDHKVTNQPQYNWKFKG